MPTSAGAKSELRQELRARRDALPTADRVHKSAQACARVLALAELTSCRTIALYAAKGSELDPRPVAEAVWKRGGRVLYPRADTAAKVLEFVAVAATEALDAGAYGVREPRGPAIDIAAAEVIIVPGLGFDERGGRLGFGAGYYDRTLARFSGRAVGLAFEVQVLASVPREPHDHPVHILVTESRTVRTV